MVAVGIGVLTGVSVLVGVALGCGVKVGVGLFVWAIVGVFVAVFVALNIETTELVCVRVRGSDELIAPISGVLPSAGPDALLKMPAFHAPPANNPSTTMIDAAINIILADLFGTGARKSSGRGVFKLLTGTGQLMKFVVRQ